MSVFSEENIRPPPTPLQKPKGDFLNPCAVPIHARFYESVLHSGLDVLFIHLQTQLKVSYAILCMVDWPEKSIDYMHIRRIKPYM